MEVLLFLNIAIIVIIITISLYIWLRNDVNYENLNTKKILKKNVLFIYPHPDDETIASGSLINFLTRKNKQNVFVVSLTKGEKGNELIRENESIIGKIRTTEFFVAMKKLGVEKASIYDFRDNEVKDELLQIRTFVKDFIIKNKIEIVVTYERTGMYGHPDHVALSKVIWDLKQELNFSTLFSTLPEKLERKFMIKKFIRNDVKIVDFVLNETPEFKFLSLRGTMKKYLAAKEYKSQILAHNSSLFNRIFAHPFEYYTTNYLTEEVATKG